MNSRAELSKHLTTIQARAKKADPRADRKPLWDANDRLRAAHAKLQRSTEQQATRTLVDAEQVVERLATTLSDNPTPAMRMAIIRSLNRIAERLERQLP